MYTQMCEFYPERVRRQIGGSDAIPKDHGLWSQIQVLVRFVCDLQRFGLRFWCFLISGTNIKLPPQACKGAPAKLADLPAGLSRSAGSQENVVLQPRTFYGERGDRPAPACL